METQSPDPGAATGATVSKPRPRGSLLLTAVVAAAAFALGGLTVATVPLAMSSMNAEPAISSMVLVEPEKHWLAAQPSFEDARRVYERNLKNMMGFIRSNIVLKPALASPTLRNLESLNRQLKPLDWMKKHLHIDSVEHTYFIRLSFDDAEPEEQVLLVNEVTNSFLRSFREYSSAPPRAS